ncbi:unnamed protein product [Adineta ricciae]|uniref:RWD domain-containing protein n=1 Tax=Adineta ricciae TaxID=249248 RepID=A0A814UBT6_ADIRI|nr:unnamed protein product [Adineta ricciae]
MANSNENISSSDKQQDEISSLRDYFKDKIRILSSIGQFSYILKVRADQYDVSLTLQLDESYPSKPPEIIITAPRLTPDQVSLVQQLLLSYSKTLLNQPMVLSIYSRLLQWFAENNIQAFETSANNSSNAPSSRSLPDAVSNAPSVSTQNSTDAAKKSSMKTAEDVISRIEWDDRLDKRYFRVGYVDRFLGLQEKAFNDFDFKVDLSTVSDRHSNILAIPKHRIQYFKYNNEIIWDKETRTDLMFGSTGNQQTIYDVIQRHDNLMENNHVTTISDDEIDHDGEQPITLPRYLTLTDGTYKPNYFLSVPITDSTLLAHYISYRDHLLSTYPSYFSARTNSSDSVHLHVTLLTLYIESTTYVDQCATVLKQLQEELRYHCSYPEPICLEFNGVGAFHDRLLYIKCKHNQRVENLRTLIVERFSEQQQKQKLTNLFFAGNYYGFVPHITLLKCKRKLSSVCPNEFDEKSFGKQTIDCLQLCSIGKIDDDDEQTAKCLFKLELS